MIPFVSPAPLSACTLVGLRNANPHPSQMSCSVAGASLPGAGGGGVKPRSRAARAAAARPAERPGELRRRRNMIITGTGPFASAGSTSVTGMSTVIAGYAELSDVPDELRADHRRPPIGARVRRRDAST